MTSILVRMVKTVTRDAIIAAARAELAATGALSINAVAGRAGVSRQSIHHHFGDARGLRAALAPEGGGGPQVDEMPTRERIIAAAARLLARPGGGPISIEAIGAEAGVTKGAVYHHFVDRAALLRAVAAHVGPIDELAATLAASEDLPAREGLVALAGAYYRALSTRADIIRNLGANTASDPELTQIVMSEILGRGAPLILGWLGRRITAGQLRAVDVSLVAQALFGPVFLRIVLGQAAFERLGDLGIRVAADNLDEYVDLLLAGIAAPAPNPAPDNADPKEGAD